MQFDFRGEMDYYMPRFLRLGRVAWPPRSELVDKASDGPLHAEFHAYYLAGRSAGLVSLANFQA